MRGARQLRLNLTLGVLLLLLALLVLLPGVGAWWIYQDVLDTTPPLPAGGIAATAAGPSHFYDRSGETPLFSIAEVTASERSWRTLAELPPQLIEATLLAEDPDFLTRPSTSPVTIAIKLWQHALGDAQPAAPLLGTRLLRSLYAPPAAPPGTLTGEREIVLTAELERLHTRADLLEWHLNTSHYGNEAWGIEAAARLYLGKAATQLTLDEVALLAAIPPEPALNPLQAEAAARQRQDELLRTMLRAGSIGARNATKALAADTALRPPGRQTARLAPEFSQLALRQTRAILESLGLAAEGMLARGGLRIHTTLDLALQESATCLSRLHLQQLRSPAPAARTCADEELLAPAPAMDVPPDVAAMAILDVTTGELLALPGEATARQYPPGPLLQPFVYFEAFRKGRTVADMLLDVPLELPGDFEGLLYTPVNNDGLFRGPLPLREAMSAGLLPPAVQLASELRLDSILARAGRLGLAGLDAHTTEQLSLLERGGVVSLLDSAWAYAGFAAQGERRGLYGREPLAVLRIDDAQGQLLWQAPRNDAADCAAAPDCTPLFAGELGYLVNDVLADQDARARVLGEADVRLLDIGRPAAVVSGVTGQRRAAWTLGYTPRYLVAAHLGRSDGSSMSSDATTTGPAAQLGRALMLALHEGLAPEAWQRPSQIVDLEVCERSGLLPNGICPMSHDLFIQGVEPQRTDSHWQLFAINTRNGRLATIDTAPELLGQRVYFVPPPEALDWWQASGLPLPPVLLDEPGQPATGLQQPEPFAWVGGVVQIRGTLDPEGLNYYLLEQGEGLNPQRWQRISTGQDAPRPPGLLGSWDTTGLSGLYSLRLIVVRDDGSRATERRQVTVDNQAPALQLEPGDGDLLWPALREIRISASVQDNLAVERVEFYRNGHLLGTDRVWPWGLDWQIQGPGRETFRAVAYDEVGNQASDEMTLRILSVRPRN